MANCDPAILTKRTVNDISPSVRDILREVTVNMDTLPVGTFKYKMFKYPGDIDIFEKIEGCCTFNSSKISAAHKILDIIDNIMTDPNIIFSEFKAGYDERFKVYTGIIEDDKVVDYNSFLIRRDIENLYSAKLLTWEQYEKLLKLVKDNPTVEEVVELNEKLRAYWVVRWNMKELATGYKLLPGNFKLFIDVALTQGSIVKLDLIIKVNEGEDSRYVELTNFFYIVQRDKYGNEMVLSEELSDYKGSILGDVYKYKDIKTLKAVKRLWMYLAFRRKVCELNLFRELFSSDIALASQISSDIEVAIKLIDSNLPYDKNFLFTTLNNRLQRLNGRCMNKPIYSNVNSSDLQVVKKNLEILKNCLDEEINIDTQKWLADRRIDLLALTRK